MILSQRLYLNTEQPIRTAEYCNADTRMANGWLRTHSSHTHTHIRNLISKSKWRWTREANWFLFGMCSLSWRLHDWVCWFNLNLIYRFDEEIDFFLLLFIEHFIRTASLPTTSNWMLWLNVAVLLVTSSDAAFHWMVYHAGKPDTVWLISVTSRDKWKYELWLRAERNPRAHT